MKIVFYDERIKKWKEWGVIGNDKKSLLEMWKRQPSVRNGLIKKWKTKSK